MSRTAADRRPTPQPRRPRPSEIPAPADAASADLVLQTEHGDLPLVGKDRPGAAGDRRANMAAAGRAAERAERDPRTGRVRMLDAETETALVLAWQRDRDHAARARLIEHYRPMIVAIATQNQAIARNGHLEDVEQEAVLALMRELDKFDAARGLRFATLARHAVKHVVSRHLMDFQGPTRIGTNLSDKKVFFAFSRLRAAWEAKTRRPLDHAGRVWIARKLDVALAAVIRMEPRLKMADVPIDFVEGEPCDNPGGLDSDLAGEIRQAVADPNGTPETRMQELCEEALHAGKLADLLAECEDALERDLLDLRLAIDGKKLSLEAIAERHGVGRKTATGAERRLLKRLRRALENAGYRREDLLGPPVDHRFAE